MVEEGAYRVVLQDIHCELPDEDVKSLKFLVQPLIKKRAYQKIEDGLGLFAALEDCRMLSRFNLDFLSELLETVGRLDLQARISEEGLSYDAVQGHDVSICPFRKLLFNLHKEIPDSDLQRMRYLWGKASKRATIEDPLDLFTLMIHEQSLTPDNLDILKKILAEITRQDLLEEIAIFEDTVEPQDCGYRYVTQQSSGPKYQEASLESISTCPPSSSPVAGSMQEFGQSFQDTEMQALGPNFQPVSFESSFSTGQSSYSQYSENAIQDLKGLSSGPAATGMSAGATGPGRSIGLRAAMDDFRMNAEQERNGASSEYYKMDADPRGLCLIIDVQEFMLPHLKYRAGSDIDRSNLISTFTKLKFNVRQMQNPTSQEITNVLEAVSRQDHSAEDCLVICILSHGGTNYFYGTDGEKVFEEHLFRLFCAKKCPSLAGKPKLFFFSYCRGTHEQEGVEVIETDGPLVPDYSDFLFGYATPQNYVSYRNKSMGTFYIEVLTRVLNEEAGRTELQHLLLRVNREVSEKQTGSANRQIPKPEHTLKRQLYFL